MKKKNCIFHIPNYIDTDAKSGSQIRPRKMIDAFLKNGYDVDIIWGYGKERKEKIEDIKRKIKNGKKYDFLYSESSTMPTLLTEKNHIPKYPRLDFGFFDFCKKSNIKIALFYRDIQWKFSFYKRNVSFFKRIISNYMYRYDLNKYQKLVDVFYLPTDEMKTYLKEYPILLNKSDILMPGCENDITYDNEKVKPFDEEGLHIFYVGGIVGIYNIEILLEAVSELKGVNLIVCCRKKEWELVKEEYRRYLTCNIRIIHSSGDELKKYYNWADICSVLGGTGEYFSMAMPVKVFEYLSNCKPMIGIKGTASGDFIENNDIGWTVDYNIDALKKCIANIISSPNIIVDIEEREKRVLMEHTWEIRAKKVIKNLEEKNEKCIIKKN